MLKNDLNYNIMRMPLANPKDISMLQGFHLAAREYLLGKILSKGVN